MSKEIFSPATLPPPVGYSHIAKVNKGTLIYLAGQVSSDASGKLVGEGDFEAQAEQVFRNLKIAVEAAGGSLADIVKLNIYLVAEVDRPRCQSCARSVTAMSMSRNRRRARWSSSAAWRGRAGWSRSRQLPRSTTETKTAPAKGAVSPMMA